MRDLAQRLAAWACSLQPSAEAVEDASRHLRDITAAAVAGAQSQAAGLVREEESPLRWAVAAHASGLDGLHLPTTTHVTTITVIATLGAGGDARAFLAGSGVMARLAEVLGREHYERGWHSTCTAGAPAAAATAAVAAGLDEERTAVAMALAALGAGGVKRAFATEAKALQVGFAVSAGLRAARLSARGARADTAILDQWVELVGGDSAVLDTGGEAVPGGLFVKLLPCSIALQRPAFAAAELGLSPAEVQGIEEVVVRTPAAALSVLRPGEPRADLGVGVAAALLDHPVTSRSFSSGREDIRALAARVRAEPVAGDGWLLAGTCEVEARLRGGEVRRTVLAEPPGHPDRPATRAQLHDKIEDGCGVLAARVEAADWATAAGLLAEAV